MADFGLARATGSVEPSLAPAESHPIRLLDSPLTLTGTRMGTPTYMSPEQHRGEPADSRSDQFSFCAALYEALYKKRPFAGSTMEELSANVHNGHVRPVPAGNPIPGLIEQALRRGLSRQPEHRFPSMSELLEALSINPQHHPAGAPRARRAFSYISIALTTLVSVAMNVVKWQGLLNIRELMLAAIILLAGGLAASWSLRETLNKNSFHRRMILTLAAMVTQMLGLRAAAVLLDFNIAQLAAMEMMALSGTILIISMQSLPEVWPVSVLLGGSSILLTQRPDLLWPVLPVVYPVMGCSLILAWNRAASQAPRAPS